ncbi:MAG: winged helix-turn-helix domain-containing protein [Vulcanimicrobiaceae bacterium]
MTRRTDSLSNVEARRIALAAQGFAGPRRGTTVSTREILSLARRLGAIQIDSVNVLVRSHYLPVFSRLGAYDRKILERVGYGKSRRLFEYWAHEASLLPIETYPLLRWRMQRARDGRGTWSNVARVGRERPDLIARVRKLVEENGPMSASEFQEAKGAGGWWGWSEAKRAFEYLFWAGELTTLARRNSFERIYDLAERAIPASVFDSSPVAEADAQRELVIIAARAFGVATEADLRDYFRFETADARARVAELVEAGRLRPVSVEGWKQVAYVDPEARIPRKIVASALLSPFDSLVWHRPRTHRLFDFHYRLEIYTPAHKRIHGYYVLPYLMDEKLVARVDLKADRTAATLNVHAVHYEPGVDRDAVRARLRDDLRDMASWLELSKVTKLRR